MKKTKRKSESEKIISQNGDEETMQHTEHLDTICFYWDQFILSSQKYQIMLIDPLSSQKSESEMITFQNAADDDEQCSFVPL